MRANLFLLKDSFLYNGIDSEYAFARKFNEFACDYSDILMSHMDDAFYCSKDMVTCEVYKDTSFIEAVEKYVDNDKKGLLYSLFANFSELINEAPIDEIKELCAYRVDEKEVNSIVYLNYYPSKIDKTHYLAFDQYEIVYSKSSWVTLRRQILGNHPGTPLEFIGNCRVLFPNLCFHDSCVSNLIDDEYEYLCVVPRKIVYYLSCLNDGFKDVLARHEKKAPDANSILEDFSSTFGLEEMGSLQRDMTKKALLTFRFSVTSPPECKGKQRDVLCEPHLKMSHPDDNYQGSVGDRFNPRIYFSFGEKGVEMGRVLVGSIGKHLA